jgi:hypothetical protein
MRVAAALAALAAVVLLSACGSLKSKPAPGPSPTVTFEPPTATNSAPATDDNKPEPSQATAPAAIDAPAPAGGISPDCVPPVPKVKPVSKPKPAHKEPPPQLPTAPVVAETPPGAVVGSEIKAMPMSVMSILGTKVQGPKGEDLGRVVDVLADATGRVRVAIIDFGGFLGVGDRRIAVEWPLLRFSPADPPSVMLSVGRDKLKSMPEYKGTERPQVLMALPPAGDGKQ